MADTGFLNPTANETGGGGFTNPSNAYSSDNSYAVSSVLGDGDVAVLSLKTFGASIPAGATIDGIEISVEWHIDDIVKTPDGGRLSVGPQKNGVNLTDGNFYNSVTPVNVDTASTTDITSTIGGPSSLFGGTWTDTDITNANFAIKMVGSVLNNDTGQSVNIYVDHVKVKIYYTAAASSSSSGGASFNPRTTMFIPM